MALVLILTFKALQDRQIYDHDNDTDDDYNCNSDSDSHSGPHSDAGYLSPWSGESRVSSEDDGSHDSGENNESRDSREYTESYVSREDDESRHSGEDNKNRDLGGSDESHNSSEDDAEIDSRVAAATEEPTVERNIGSKALLESMTGVESVLGQLIRLILRVRQSAAFKGGRKEDTTPEDKKHIILRQELTTKLLIGNTFIGTQDVVPDRTWDGLSKVQIRVISSVLRRWNDFKNVRDSYPVAGNRTTNEVIDRTTRKLASIISQKAPDTVFRPGPILGRSSTQADLEPDLTRIFTKGGALHYFEALKIVNNGMSVWQCPCCARIYSESFVGDSQRWRLVSPSMNFLSCLTMVLENTSIEIFCHMYAQLKLAIFPTPAMARPRSGSHILPRTTPGTHIGDARPAAKEQKRHIIFASISNRTMRML